MRAGCSAGPALRRAATGLSVAAGWESRSPSEVESDDQAINPARGGEGAAAKIKDAVPIAPQPLSQTKASGGDAARTKALPAVRSSIYSSALHCFRLPRPDPARGFPAGTPVGMPMPKLLDVQFLPLSTAPTGSARRATDKEFVGPAARNVDERSEGG